MFILGIVLAALILLIVFGLTVGAYLRFSARHPSRKFRAEVTVVGVVLVGSLIIRMIIGWSNVDDKTFADGVASFFHGVLAAAGGLTFESPLELSAVARGLTSCLYYGIIVYASLVFLAVVTVGLSYEFYSRVQSIFLRWRFRYFFIFTEITSDSILLAKDIKNQYAGNHGRNRAVIIFFENGEQSFSRKNRLHRKIMEEGFLYYSDFRRTDRGDTISLLRKFRFAKRHFKRDDKGENYGKLFNVFAMGDCGGFEGENAGVVFEDIESVLAHYTKVKRGKMKGIPTTVNYYILTGGEINYESYEHRVNSLIDGYLPVKVEGDGKEESAENRETAEIKTKQELKRLAKEKKRAEKNAEKETKRSIETNASAKLKIQVNVFNEATLSSQDLIEKRKLQLRLDGEKAFEHDREPDGNGAYRIAVFGFGKTGQYALEELYTQTAYLIESGGEYKPTQFIADVYDVTVKEKSGLFAYNHPLFRCLNGDKEGTARPTREVVEEAGKMDGAAFDALYSACETKSKGKFSGEAARNYVEEKMAFPIAVFHPQSCFAFPLMRGGSTDATVKDAVLNDIRAIVVALGDDERNIAMANVLIDSFKRAFYTKERERCNVRIYVNLIEKDSVDRLDWTEDDRNRFSVVGGASRPYLSVITFGCRNDMFSYHTIIDDYGAQLYNYGYDIVQKDGGKSVFTQKLGNDYNAYRETRDLYEKWWGLEQFKRQSNRSAQDFAENYYEYKKELKGELSDADITFLGRLEHERWNRYHISHGWIYGDFAKPDKLARRGMRHHECLCPYDVMLDDGTKEYDLFNVRLGFIEGIVYGGQSKGGAPTDDGENNEKKDGGVSH